MEQLIELLKQIQELAGAGVEALEGAAAEAGGAEGGAPAGPPEGGGGPEGGGPAGPPEGGPGGPPPEDEGMKKG